MIQRTLKKIFGFAIALLIMLLAVSGLQTFTAPHSQALPAQNIRPATAMNQSVSAKQNNAQQKIKTAIEQIKNNHGITIQYQDIPQHQSIDFEEGANQNDILGMLDIINSALTKYPENFAKKINLQSFYFVTDLTANMNPLNAFATASYSSLQAPSPGKEEHLASSIYFNVDPEYQSETTIHHEMMHTIEYHQAFDPAVNIIQENAWQNANPFAEYLISSSQYANAYEIMQHPGFVVSSSRIDPMEDRATIFALLQNPSDDALANAKYAADSFLKKKASLVMAYLDVVFAESAQKNAWDHGFRKLFLQKKFALIAAYTIQPGTTARLGPTDQYAVIDIALDAILYKVETLQNPSDMIALLNNNLQLIYLHQSDLLELKQDILKISDELTQNYAITLKTLPVSSDYPNIHFDPVISDSTAGTDEQSAQNQLLATAKLTELSAVLKNLDDQINLNTIKNVVPVMNLKNNAKETPILLLKDTLIIDIVRCKKSDMSLYLRLSIPK